MDRSELRSRADACRQEASRSRDSVEREIWLRLATHWEQVDEDVDIAAARQSKDTSK